MSEAVVLPKTAPRRRQGRPAAQEPSVGRDRLLQRTCELLREIPPADLSRAELARRSGVDPALIRYYFKDRASLLVAAGGALIDELNDRHRIALAEVGDDPAAQLRARVRVFLRFIKANPYFHRLMMDEFMHSGSQVIRDSHRAWTSRAIESMRDMVSRGAQAGEFKPVDGAMVFMASLGASEFFINSRPIQRMAFGDDVDEDAVLLRYEDFLVDLIERGLRP